MTEPEEYTCELCGQTFEKARSDEEALEETRQLIAPVPEGEDASLAVVCHGCWLVFMEWAAAKGILKH